MLKAMRCIVENSKSALSSVVYGPLKLPLPAYNMAFTASS